jgi:CBS domain-containing protein
MNMRVLEIMVGNPVRISPDASVREVAKLMRDKSVGSVILVEDDLPVGIVTERDLVRRVLASDRDTEPMKAFDICSKPVISILDLDEVDVAVGLMKRHRIRRLAVINRDDKVVGILTTDDIGYNLRRLSEELAIDYMVLSRRQ